MIVYRGSVECLSRSSVECLSTSSVEGIVFYKCEECPAFGFFLPFFLLLPPFFILSLELGVTTVITPLSVETRCLLLN